MALPRLGGSRGATPRPHRLFAALYERMSRAAERAEGPHREELCGGAAGRVLEVGSGNGMNFAHYRSAERVAALEPDPHMLRRSVGRARAAAVSVAVVRGVGERLPFPDGSFDSVVISLTLCSVSDLPGTLAECRRVLRPAGALRFYEHVRSTSERIARWQDRVERPWGVVAAGCHPNRDTLAALRDAGFSVSYRRFDAPFPVGRFMPHVLGEARPR